MCLNFNVFHITLHTSITMLETADLDILNNIAICLNASPVAKYLKKYIFTNLVTNKNWFTGEDVKRKWKNIRDTYLKEKKKVKKSRSGDSQDNAEVYTGKWVYYHLLHFLKDTTTPRTTEGNVSKENETQLQMSDLSDSEEVNSFSSSFIDIEDNIQSPENPVSVTQSECFTIPSTSNLSHVNISTSISNDSDTSSKTSSIKRKKSKKIKVLKVNY